MNHHHDHALARALYARPNADSMIKNLPDLGKGLSTAANELAHEVSLDKIDAFLAKLKGAETSLLHLRRGLAEQDA